MKNDVESYCDASELEKLPSFVQNGQTKKSASVVNFILLWYNCP